MKEEEMRDFEVDGNYFVFSSHLDKNKETNKVDLVRIEKKGWSVPGHHTKSIAKALPFYISRQGKYYHRVRSMQAHWRDGHLSHISVGFWCGNAGFIGSKGNLAGTVPDGEVLCAVCEGKAIGSGMDGAREINGRKVMYSPRGKGGDND
jgi:hypothetical protein